MNSKIRIIFFGSPEFAAVGLRHLIAHPAFTVVAAVTQPDRPAGRGAKLTPPPVKQTALDAGIPVFQPVSIRKDLVNFLTSLNTVAPFDVGVVIAFGQILPQAVLDLPRHGCVNTHASLLPRWRGAAPIHRAVMAGDAESGVCLMRMEAGLDTGPVFSRDLVRLQADETTGSLHDTLATVAAAMLVRDLPAICSGSLQAIPQSSEGITYAQKITNAEAKIDWSKSAREIERHVRALSPVPGAFCEFQGRRLKILRASAHDTMSSVAASSPGLISVVDRQRLEISCGTGSLSLLEVQPEGKRRMEIADFLQGARINSDERIA